MRGGGEGPSQHHTRGDGGLVRAARPLIRSINQSPTPHSAPLAKVVAEARAAGLLPAGHFSVDGMSPKAGR